MEDIGEGDEDALLCRTNLNGSGIGNWFFPNGIRVPSRKNSVSTFHRTRSSKVVRLEHRRDGGEDGIYRCEILDSMKVTQTIYIGVYTSTGE